MLSEQIESDKREDKDKSEETRKAKYREKLKKQAARIEEFFTEKRTQTRQAV